jgi:hypothetical protein
LIDHHQQVRHADAIITSGDVRRASRRIAFIGNAIAVFIGAGGVVNIALVVHSVAVAIRRGWEKREYGNRSNVDQALMVIELCAGGGELKPGCDGYGAAEVVKWRTIVGGDPRMLRPRLTIMLKRKNRSARAAGCGIENGAHQCNVVVKRN